MAVPESAHGTIEGTFLAAELVVDFTDAIERDADIGDVGCFEQRGLFRSDERAVGGNREFQTFFGGVIDEVEKARVDHRFATGEQQRGDLIG